MQETFCIAGYKGNAWGKLYQYPTRISRKKMQDHQCHASPGSRSLSPRFRRKYAIPRSTKSTQGIATLLPSALYRALSDAPGMSVQPSGKPCRRSHSRGMENRKNLCAMIPEALHAQARTEQEQMNLTLSQYVEMVLKEHFENGGKNMANGTTRTLAFQDQVPFLHDAFVLADVLVPDSLLIIAAQGPYCFLVAFLPVPILFLLGIGIAFPMHCLYTWLTENGERRNGAWKTVKTYAR